MIVIGGLVACDGVTRAVQATATPHLASSASPTIAPPQPHASAGATQSAMPQQIIKGAAATTSPPVVRTKTPTPPVAVPALTNSSKQGDDLEQQLDQLLNDLDHADTVDDAGK